MEKLPKFIYQLAAALLVLAISIFICINILLAGMPMMRDVSEQLNSVNWRGVNDFLQFTFKGFIILFLMVWVTKMLFAKKKESIESPEDTRYKNHFNDNY